MELTPMTLPRAMNVDRLFTLYHITMEDPYLFPGEQHPFWELDCVLHGSAGITSGSEVFRLEAGEAVLHPPGCGRGIGVPADRLHGGQSLASRFGAEGAACGGRALRRILLPGDGGVFDGAQSEGLAMRGLLGASGGALDATGSEGRAGRICGCRPSEHPDERRSRHHRMGDEA